MNLSFTFKLISSIVTGLSSSFVCHMLTERTVSIWAYVLVFLIGFVLVFSELSTPRLMKVNVNDLPKKRNKNKF